MRIPRGPLKSTLVLLVVAGALAVGLLAIQGRLIPRKPARDTIAFISTRAGHPDLWIMGTDGSSPRAITKDTRPDAAPSWSRDATRIVFTSAHSGTMQIFMVDAIGKRKPQQLTIGTGVKLQPVFSPDGSRIAYLSQGRVYVIGADGAHIEPVLPSEAVGLENAGIQGPFLEADWSADGRSLGVVQKSEGLQIPQVLEDLTGQPRIVTDLQGRPLTGQRASIKWAPAGRRLAVSTVAGNKGALVVLDYDEESVTLAVTDTATGRAAWSPSGSQIAFEVLKYREGHGYSIVGLGVADLEEETHRVIASGEILNPSWCSDGELIIFTRTQEDGTRAVWSIRPDGSGARNLMRDRGDNYDAAVAPAVRE
ncbi:MAG: hypothetical protein Q7T82_16910 [Armatimonadota bacterium]|nr:hypothetical protein [Armatimonadota bacterium]